MYPPLPLFIAIVFLNAAASQFIPLPQPAAAPAAPSISTMTGEDEHTDLPASL